MKKLSLSIFILSGPAILFTSLTSAQWIFLFSKPLIMTSLGLFYFFSQKSNRSPIVMGAILCALIGDVVLLWDENLVFGLMSFLVGNLLYTVAYKQHRFEETENDLTGVHRARLAFPIILGGTGLIVVIYPLLGSLKIPVTFYGIVVICMVITALFRYGHTTSQSFWMVFGGAVLFMISNGILAIDKLLQPLSYAQPSIMSLYVLSQYMIIKGLLLHSTEH